VSEKPEPNERDYGIAAEIVRLGYQAALGEGGEVTPAKAQATALIAAYRVEIAAEAKRAGAREALEKAGIEIGVLLVRAINSNFNADDLRDALAAQPSADPQPAKAPAYLGDLCPNPQPVQPAPEKKKLPTLEELEAILADDSVDVEVLQDGSTRPLVLPLGHAYDGAKGRDFCYHPVPCEPFKDSFGVNCSMAYCGQPAADHENVR
jgi:hypothetical protein